MSEAKLKTLMPFVWQKDQWQTVMNQFQSQKMPHGLLVQGVSGLGKKHFALALAQTMLCHNPVDQVACGECKSCKLMMTDNHPDYFLVEPESEGKAIKIDQIREVVSFLSKTAQQGGFKCIVITPADAMNDNARNALLKSLEEPQGDTIIILVSSHPSRLSATIRSRCQSIFIRIPHRSIALEWLKSKVGDEHADSLLKGAHGAPIAALEAYKDDLPGQINDFENILDNVISGAQSISDGAKRIVDLGSLKAIDFLLDHLSNSLLLKLTDDGHIAEKTDINSSMINITIKQNKGAQGSLYFNQYGDSQLLFRFRDKVLDFKRLLLSSANPNPQLLCEEIMMDWIALNRRQSATRPRIHMGQ